MPSLICERQPTAEKLRGLLSRAENDTGSDQTFEVADEQMEFCRRDNRHMVGSKVWPIKVLCSGHFYLTQQYQLTLFWEKDYPMSSEMP
jgi:hypothetical protein